MVHTPLRTGGPSNANLSYDILRVVFAEVFSHIVDVDMEGWARQRTHLGGVCPLWCDAVASLPWLWCKLYIPIDATCDNASRLIEEAISLSGTGVMSW
jgi:hypothetical protein